MLAGPLSGRGRPADRQRCGSSVLWQIPSKGELLPVSELQSGAICGEGDWKWLHFLLNAPEWVQELGWLANWFITTCGTCQRLWNDDDAFLVRWRMNDDDHAGRGFEEYRRVIAAMQSEPPLPRLDAVA